MKVKIIYLRVRGVTEESLSGKVCRVAFPDDYLQIADGDEIYCIAGNYIMKWEETEEKGDINICKEESEWKSK